MRKDLSPRIDAPALSCYSKYDVAPTDTRGATSPPYKSSRRIVFHPRLTFGGRHLSVSPVNALCGVSFLPVKLPSC